MIFAYVHGDVLVDASRDNCVFVKLSAPSTLASTLFWKLVVQKRPASVIAFGNTCVMVAALVRLISLRRFVLVGSERSNLSMNNKFLNKYFGFYKILLRFSYLFCNKIHCVSEGSKSDLCKF